MREEVWAVIPKGPHLLNVKGYGVFTMSHSSGLNRLQSFLLCNPPASTLTPGPPPRPTHFRVTHSPPCLINLVVLK